MDLQPHRFRPLMAVTLCLTLFVVVPVTLSISGSGYASRIAQMCLVYGILVAGLSFCAGTAGLLSFAHTAIFGVGSYASALLSIRYGLPVGIAIAGATIVGTAIGALVLAPLLRLESLYFAVATLAVAEIAHVVFRDWSTVTGGVMGVRNIPPLWSGGSMMANPVGVYLTLALVAVIVFFLLHLVYHSYFGNAVRAVREDPVCAEASGIEPFAIRLQAVVISCAAASMAGALYAHTAGFVSPEAFGILEAALVMTCVVIGGFGSLPGALIGTVVLLTLPELTRPLGSFRILAYGLMLFVTILFLPRGLFGEVVALRAVREGCGVAWRTARGAVVGWR